MITTTHLMLFFSTGETMRKVSPLFCPRLVAVVQHFSTMHGAGLSLGLMGFLLGHHWHQSWAGLQGRIPIRALVT
uniref:Uncharacterized protein n=1 Tax=Rhizophora mucronata TaxID=61149 RepID=A0A2P2J3A0_RHIMU